MNTAIIPSSRGYKFKSLQLRKEAEALRETLRNLDMRGRRVKQATLGGEPEQSFEQAFAALAYSYIKDKAPRLIDFLTGFQLVDRNEDNTKAIGIFGFKIGKQWVYAPVFFLNSDLKGHELLYLKDQDMFVPMKENWVNYLMSKKPHILGEGSAQSRERLGVLAPDIRSMSIPPYYSKYGSADWYKEAQPCLGRLATESVAEKYPRLNEKLNLPRMLAESVALTKVAMQACRSYPEIHRLCRQYYGQDFLKQALLELRYKAVTAGGPSILEAPRTKKAAGPPVEIQVQDSATLSKNAPELTEEEQEKLLRDGVLIRDHRNGEEVSKLYDVQVKAELVNPDESGVYDVLIRPGEFQEMLVVNEGRTGRGKVDFASVVRTSGNKSWINVHRGRLWTRPNRRTREEQKDWLDNQSSASISTGGTYIIVSQSYTGGLEGSVPFTVRESLGDGKYRVTWHDWPDRKRPTYLRNQDNDRPSGDWFLHGNWDRDQDLHQDGDILWLNEREGSRFKSMRGQLFVPPEAKIITIEAPENEEDGELSYCCASPQSKSEAIDPGSIEDIQAMLLQKTAEVKLWADGNEVSINSGPLQSKKAALIELVRGYGFREKTARHLIRESELAHMRGKPALYRVKYAQGYPMLGPGPGAPPIPPQEYGYDSTYGGVPTTYQQTDFTAAPEMSAALTDPSVYDSSPEAMPDPMAMQQAQQAGQMGQKEVFDTSMISGLLRAVRQDSLVEKYTGDLMKGLDRLGRILFQFYWHNDDFMDRYGKADMPELEDTLRNAFEVLGDLVLFLREKDVQAETSLEMSSPTVDESAE